MVDGRTVRECLDIFQRDMREGHATGRRLTPGQLTAARTAWSAALKAKAVEAAEKEHRRVVVDDDRWEP